MKVPFSRKTISIPTYLANRLDQVSDNTGYSVSNLIQQELAKFLYRFEYQEEPVESMEHWLERLGRTSGLYDPDDVDEPEDSDDAYFAQLIATLDEGETLM